MDLIFINTLDKSKYRYTNILWNRGYSSSWVVGYVTKLISMKDFKTKEEWVDYYFELGEKRKKILNSYDSFDVQMFYQKDGERLAPNNMKYINYDMGRTKEEIRSLGRELYKEVLKEGNKVGLTERDCIYCAYFRVICETWNGIKGREFNTKNNILKYYKDKNIEVELVKTNSRFDDKYAVDYEVYYDGNILCGIQIKPISYLKMNTNYNKFKEANIRKNEVYLERYKRSVYYIYSEIDGRFDISELEPITNKIKSIKSA